MNQPVINTLELCDALRKTGMEGEQAEGLARALGKELGAHVAVRSDLQLGFQGVRNDLGSEIQKVRSDLGSEIQKVRNDLGAEIEKVRSDLGSEIQKVRNDLGTEIQKVRSDLGSEIQKLRSDLTAKFQAVDKKVDVLRAELTARMDALESKLTFMIAGFGLLLTVLTVAGGMGLFQRPPPSPQPQWVPEVVTPSSPNAAAAPTPQVAAPAAQAPASP